MADPRDDNYQYPGEEKSQEYSRSSMQGSTEGIKTVLRNPKVLMIGGGFIAFFLISHLFSLLFGGSSRQKVVVPAEKPAQTQPVVQQKNNLMDQLKASDQQKHEALDRLEQNNQKTQSQVTDLSNTLQRLQNQVDQIDRKMDDISNQMRKMTEKTKLVVKPVQTDGPKKVMTIRALQIGRAWLNDGSDQTISVAVGDVLKSYGKVTNILVDDGMVLTSSGRVIEFGPNDQ